MIALLASMMLQIPGTFPHDPNRLNSLEIEGGWRLIWDGQTSSGWESAQDEVRIHDGWMMEGSVGAGIRCNTLRSSFDLQLEWRQGDAQGILQVFRAPSDGWNNVTRALGIPAPDGFEYPSGRYVPRKFTYGLEPGFVIASHDASQGLIQIRTVRARDRSHPPGPAIELFNCKDLSGWRALGDALWTVDDKSIVGAVGGGSQSFLITERTFGDFVLDVEVKNEAPGNSGIQVRSQVREDGQLFGYQIEIDPSERAWSGGLYDEARRGWLQDLKQNHDGRRAFTPGEWNHYRIECIGPWIRAWVNAVPTVDCFDPLDLEGVIGLQVHSGKDTRVRWRNFRLVDLGTRRWESLPDLRKAPSQIRILTPRDRGPCQSFRLLELANKAEDIGLRLSLKRPATRLTLHLRGSEPNLDEAKPLPVIGPAILRAQQGVNVELADEAIWSGTSDGHVAEVVLFVYGDRMTLFVDGSLLTSARDDGALRIGKVFLSSPGNGVEAVQEAAFMVRQ